MSEFTSADLIAAAKQRYKEAVLRQRMIGAGGNAVLADAELVEIAEGVIGRIRSAAQSSVGWPVLVTSNVLQHALELFNWRTLAALEGISTDQRRIGEAAEKFFEGLADGDEAWGIGTTTDVGVPAPMAARGRDGTSFVAGVPSRRNLFGELTGMGWDRVR